MTRSLVALAVSLDGNGIKFGLGDNGDLSVEVDAKINALGLAYAMTYHAQLRSRDPRIMLVL